MTIYYTCVSINTIVQPDTIQVASKPTRNGTVHLMNILLATITSTAFTGLLTCQQANGIINKIEPSFEKRSEIIQLIKDSSEQCEWDAKAD